VTDHGAILAASPNRQLEPTLAAVEAQPSIINRGARKRLLLLLSIRLGLGPHSASSSAAKTPDQFRHRQIDAPTSANNQGYKSGANIVRACRLRGDVSNAILFSQPPNSGGPLSRLAPTKTGTKNNVMRAKKLFYASVYCSRKIQSCVTGAAHEMRYVLFLIAVRFWRARINEKSLLAPINILASRYFFHLRSGRGANAGADHSCRQATGSDSGLYNYAAAVSHLLRPMDVVGKRFIRKGRDFDGGYVMLDYNIENSVVYSFGISYDVSWDLEMAAMGCHVFQYDHTIPFLPQWHKNFHFSRRGVAEENAERENFCSVSEAIRDNFHSNRKDIILKMDIEGDEWIVLDSLSERTLSQFAQIIVELHGVACVAQPELRRFRLGVLNRLLLTHQPVHLHANNFAQMIHLHDLELPDVIEATLVRRSDHDFIKCERAFPTELDMPSNKDAADYAWHLCGP
jgi:hypothetical protein